MLKLLLCAAVRKESVVVLGAGFAGLVAAYQLKCFGYKVTVCAFHSPFVILFKHVLRYVK